MTVRQMELVACLAAAALLGFAGGFYVRRAAGGPAEARLRAECARLQAEVDRLSAQLAALDQGGMPRPPAWTRRQQAADAAEPPVVDEQVPRGGQAGSGVPEPAASTRRQQNTTGDEPPVVDEQVPPDSGRSGSRRKS